MNTITIRIRCGERIESACCKAVDLAKRTKSRVEFDFNEVRLYATPKRCVDSIMWDYHMAMSR